MAEMKSLMLDVRKMRGTRNYAWWYLLEASPITIASGMWLSMLSWDADDAVAVDDGLARSIGGFHKFHALYLDVSEVATMTSSMVWNNPVSIIPKPTPQRRCPKRTRRPAQAPQRQTGGTPHGRFRGLESGMRWCHESISANPPATASNNEEKRTRSEGVVALQRCKLHVPRRLVDRPWTPFD